MRDTGSSGGGGGRERAPAAARAPKANAPPWHRQDRARRSPPSRASRPEGTGGSAALPTRGPLTERRGLTRAENRHSPRGEQPGTQAAPRLPRPQLHAGPVRRGMKPAARAAGRRRPVLTFLPRNASGISKQVNRGAARRNYCSGFVKFANLFGGGVSGARKEQGTCWKRSRAWPARRSRGDRASLFPGDAIFPHLMHLSVSKEKTFKCPISSEIRGRKKKKEGETAKRGFCYTSSLQNTRRGKTKKRTDSPIDSVTCWVRAGLV